MNIISIEITVALCGELWYVLWLQREGYSSLICAMFWMMVLQDMLRERMVASSRGSPGRLTDGASSKMKCTWQGKAP